MLVDQRLAPLHRRFFDRISKSRPGKLFFLCSSIQCPRCMNVTLFVDVTETCRSNREFINSFRQLSLQLVLGFPFFIRFSVGFNFYPFGRERL